MRHLCRTTAIAAALSCFAFAANAQQDDQATAANAQPGAGTEASYCDMPWVQVDGNDDGFVSMEEATGAVDSQFGQIDTNANGEITKTEWVDCLTRMRLQSAEADRSEQNFAEADADQDDRIDRNEFRDSARQAFEESRAADAGDDAVLLLRRYLFLVPEDDQALGDMTADEAAGRSALTFSALDRNGDDIIDTMEWSERSPRVTRDEDWANARFDEIDEDKTGSISQEEYRTARRQMLDETTTGATAGTGAGEDETASTGDDASSGSDQGVPVFVYRFLAL